MDKSVIVARRVKLIVGMVVILFAGIITAWTILMAPFMQTELGYELASSVHFAQLGIVFTVTMIFFCFGNICSGLISKQTTASLRFVLSGMLLFSSFYISSLSIVTLPTTGNYFLLYCSYGLLGGLGSGMAYNTVISTMNMWYPDKRGFCSGLLIASFGLSLLIIGKIADIMGRSESIGWQNTYVYIGITLGVVMLLAAIVIRPPKKDIGISEVKSKGKARAINKIKNFKTAEMMKTPSFWYIFIFISIVAATGNAALGFASRIAFDLGSTESFAIFVVGILGVSNGIGRLLSGWLFDSVGIKKTQLLSSVIAVMAPLFVALAFVGNSLLLGVIGLCFCGLSFGFAPTSCSIFASGFYGQKNFHLNFSVLGLILIPASFATTLAGNLRASTGSFEIVFFILTGFAAVGFLLSLLIKQPK
ncbi:MAG: MFS transporter [Oscillospiraceae bacterium]|jgi:OFA family oxalate/formate antiporter-like MFS transporter|nr:MFS transporter [Oscillospiraceae bacterium]